MKKILSVIVALAFASAASAQIIVYKQTLSANRTGAGQSQTWKLSGFQILDLQNERLIMFGIEAKTKRFTVYEHPVWRIRTVQGPRSANAFLSVEAGRFTDLRAKGLSRPADIGAGKISIPNSLAVTGTTIFDFDENSYSSEFKGRFVFDKRDTQTAQRTAQTLDQTVEKFRTLYAGKGYQEIAIDDVLPF